MVQDIQVEYSGSLTLVSHWPEIFDTRISPHVFVLNIMESHYKLGGHRKQSILIIMESFIPTIFNAGKFLILLPDIIAKILISKRNWGRIYIWK